MREIELLNGLAKSNKNAEKKVSDFLKSILPDSPDQLKTWMNRFSAPIFEQVYLLDYAKINQGTARDSQEMSLTVANAIESFLISDSDTYIDQASL